MKVILELPNIEPKKPCFWCKLQRDWVCIPTNQRIPLFKYEDDGVITYDYPPTPPSFCPLKVVPDEMRSNEKRSKYTLEEFGIEC